MTIYKKLLIFIILLLTIGVIIFNFKKQVILINSSLQQEEVMIKDETKSKCEKQLETLPDEVIEKFDGIPQPVNFTTFPEAKLYYSRITNDVALGANFAGHFTLAEWGCGTVCFGYAIIDVKTGAIIAYSAGNVNYLLRDYQVDNNILVFEPFSAGQERKFYRIVETQGGKSRLDLFCTEVSSKNMYQED